ncbi:MAG: hypothetical protein V3U46_03125 [Acidimicrobiia bacterium]
MKGETQVFQPAKRIWVNFGEFVFSPGASGARSLDVVVLFLPQIIEWYTHKGRVGRLVN